MRLEPYFELPCLQLALGLEENPRHPRIRTESIPVGAEGGWGAD